jgi:hypothetical protein
MRQARQQAGVIEIACALRLPRDVPVLEKRKAGAFVVRAHSSLPNRINVASSK